MKTLFPNRVWQPTGNGWVTREPTAEDHARRKEYREKLRTLQNPVNKLRAYVEQTEQPWSAMRVMCACPHRHEYFDGSGE